MHPHLLPFLVCSLIGVNLVNLGAELAECRRWLGPRQALLAVLGSWEINFLVGLLFLL